MIRVIACLQVLFERFFKTTNIHFTPTRRDDGLFSISLPMKQVTGLNLHPVAVLRVEQQAEAVRFVVQELRMGNAAMDR